MNKLQEIENALISINDAVFQNLCDAYLFFTEEGYPEIDRTGSQKGKQKTKKGTPDSFYQKPNGRYVLIEYTTKNKKDSAKAFLQKVKDDINKCLNEELTGLKVDEIDKIIYCCNAEINLKEQARLINYCAEKRIRLELKTLDKISITLLGRAMFVAKEFLGISVDTGQILTPEKFTEEYEASGYATPLSNSFHFREKELEDLQTAILSKQICILSGSPGVGKSRLALAAIKNIQQSNKATVYCLSNKSAPIYEDLRLYLNEDRPFIILIDDANRQHRNLESLFGLLREKRTNKIRVVITVRDYALSQMQQECAEFFPKVIGLERLTNEQIDELLKSSDFNIQNHLYRDKIVSIASGNPRLAIMAARLAIEKQDVNALNDVSELYDRYFENALASSDVLTDKTLLKTIGLVTFFYSVNLEDRGFVQKICRDFGISKHDFITNIERLERLELLESSPGFNVVRMPEQVLSNYFFYRSFFKDAVLHFAIVLDKYFDTHLHRIRDTIIPANNTFGYERVYEKIDPELSAFWPLVKPIPEKAFKFLELFWFYKMDEALAFVDEAITHLTPPKGAKYVWDEKAVNNLHSGNRNQYINLLANFFPYFTGKSSDAFELSYEYVRRRPESYSQLIKRVTDSFIFSYEDELQGFQRQIELIEFLIRKAKRGGPLSTAMFFDVVGKLMKTSFHVVSSGREKQSIAFYQYNLPVTSEVKLFRKKVWSFIIDYYSKFRKRIADFIIEYVERTPDKVKAVFTFDLPFIIRLFKSHFTPEEFSHVYAVQSLVWWFRRRGIHQKQLTDLKRKFSTEAYRVYCIISQDRIRDKEDFEYENHEEFQRLKEVQIRRSFHFADIASFKEFYSLYEELVNWSKSTYPLFGWALDLILDEIAQRSIQLLTQCLKYIIRKRNVGRYLPYRPFSRLCESADSTYRESIFEFITEKEFLSRSLWIQQYLRLVSEDELTVRHADVLLDLYRTETGSIHADFSFLQKFKNVVPELPVRLLELIVDKNEFANGKIQLDWSFFSDYTTLFAHRVDLLKRAYFLEDQLNPHFDHNSEDFFRLLQLDRGFLIEYTDFYLKKNFTIRPRDHQGMSAIWKFADAEKLLTQLFDHLNTIRPYYIREDFCNVFFVRLSEEDKKRALKFLKAYLKNNCQEAGKVNTVFDIIRHSLRSELESFLHYFLSINPTFEAFSKIELLDNYFMGNGKTIWADVKAKQLTDYLEIIERIKTKQYRFVQHKQYLKDRINSEKRAADYERLRSFVTGE